MAARARLILPLLIVFAAIFALVLIRRVRDGVPPPPRELFPTGELRIGIDPSNPPFAAATANDLYGLDIDLSRELGKRLDLPVRFVYLGFDGLYDALKSDQVDALVAGLLIDLTRLNDVHYSQAYFNAGLVLVSDKGLSRMEDLPGHSLAYEFGSEADAQARTWLRRILPFETRPYELGRYALDAARLGDADAALVDAVSAHLYLRDHADWHPNLNTITDNLYAIATQSRRPEISVVINQALQSMIDDGTLDTILKRWL
ncbi:MAG: ABC transporter substrate-binding protein [Chloroflexota bacterium]